MKRLFFILLFFGVLLMCACGKEYGILDYQGKSITAECVVNGEYRVQIAKTESLCTVTVKEPKAAQGISFEIGEGGVLAKASGTEIQIPKEYLGGICALGAIFSQSEECLTSATQKGGGSVLTFRSQGCTYRITVGENSMPKQVSIYSESFEYDVEICTIELN